MPTPRATVRIKARRARQRHGMEEPAWVKWLLIGVVLVFSLVFLLLPLVNLFVQAFSKGWGGYVASLQHPDSWAAIKLTLLVAGICVPLNMVFGVASAWAITKFDFRGKSLLITLIDLPFSISPVVSGLMLVVMFGAQGFLGGWLREHDLRVVFALPGIVLATLFVTSPFVARELIPIMQAAGSEQEQAALTLGAGGWRTFWYVTLPSVKWGLIYGVILCSARAMGEYGAVSVVSSRIAGVSDTMPLRVDKLLHDYNAAGAFAVASLLALLALVTLVLKVFMEWRQQRKMELAETLDEGNGKA
jgi:sulfate/thiosulfate transport system permease protein